MVKTESLRDAAAPSSRASLNDVPRPNAVVHAAIGKIQRDFMNAQIEQAWVPVSVDSQLIEDSGDIQRKQRVPKSAMF